MDSISLNAVLESFSRASEWSCALALLTASKTWSVSADLVSCPAHFQDQLGKAGFQIGKIPQDTTRYFLILCDASCCEN